MHTSNYALPFSWLMNDIKMYVDWTLASDKCFCYLLLKINNNYLMKMKKMYDKGAGQGPNLKRIK